MRFSSHLVCRMIFSVKINPVLIALSLCATSSSFAKNQIYKYSDGMCEYQNTYDDQKHSLKQIKDSLKLYQDAFSLKLNINENKYSLSHPPSLAEIKKFEQHSQNIKVSYHALTPVNLAKYHELKHIVLRQLNDEYLLNHLELNGYHNPKVLLTPRFGQKCYAIAERMNLKGQSLINASRSLVLENMAEEYKKGQQDPKWIKEKITRFDREIAQSKNQSDYAYSSLMWSWHNCVVAALPNDDVKLKKLYPQKDLFTKSQELCDY